MAVGGSGRQTHRKPRLRMTKEVPTTEKMSETLFVACGGWGAASRAPSRQETFPSCKAATKPPLVAAVLQTDASQKTETSTPSTWPNWPMKEAKSAVELCDALPRTCSDPRERAHHGRTYRARERERSDDAWGRKPAAWSEPRAPVGRAIVRARAPSSGSRGWWRSPRRAPRRRRCRARTCAPLATTPFGDARRRRGTRVPLRATRACPLARRG
eukprot:5102068-Pleurochrysis_carterae.AAC.8